MPDHADPAIAVPTTREAVGRWPASLASLAYRGFQLLLVGTILTQMGQWMQQVALGWLVLDLTGSSFYLGLASFLRSIPMLFLSLPGGILADRVHQGRLLAVAQALAAAFALVLAILIGTGTVQLWHVLALSFLSGSAMSLLFPVRQALVSVVVPRRMIGNAVALNSAGNNVTRMAGPSLAGILISAIGVAACFFVQTAGLILAFWSSLAIKVKPREREVVRRDAVSDLVETFRYIQGDRAMFGLILAAGVPTVFGMPYISFLPAVARDLGIGATGLGLLMTAVGAGSVLGSTAFALVGSVRRMGLLQLACVALFGVSLVAFSLAGSLYVAVPLLALAGISSAVYMASNNTLLQTRAPDALRGRIMSVYLLTWGLMPLGTLPLGVLADAAGPSFAVGLGGALCFVFALVVAYFQPELRRLELGPVAS